MNNALRVARPNLRSKYVGRAYAQGDIQLTSAALSVPVLALIWAGVSLGGSLVAAPAKFRAPSLDRPTALEVGRAQFSWLGATEGVLCVALIGVLVLSAPGAWRWMAVPTACVETSVASYLTARPSRGRCRRHCHCRHKRHRF